jgi:hypothetical protein
MNPFLETLFNCSFSVFLKIRHSEVREIRVRLRREDTCKCVSACNAATRHGVLETLYY